MVASAREVAPPGDNPLTFVQRLGERLAWTTIHGRIVWPQNARNNVLSYYLLGRRRGSVGEWLVTLAPFALMMMLDIGALASWASRSFPALIVVQFVLGSLLFFPLLFLSSAALGFLHVSAVQNSVSFGEIAVTRLEPGALLYGLSVRPLANLHLFNLLYNVISYGSLAVVTLLVVGESTATFGRTAPLPSDIVNATVGLGIALAIVLIRGILYALIINLGVGFAVRARLFHRQNKEAVVRFFKDVSLFIMEYAVLMLCSFFLFITLAFAGVCCAFPFAALSIFLLSVFLKRLIRRAAIVIEFTTRHFRHWWIWMPEEDTGIPEEVAAEW